MNKLKTQYEKFCRLCAKYTRSSVNTYNLDSDKIKYIDKLKYSFNDLILEEDDNKSFPLCNKCCAKLRQVYEFKQQCKSSFDFWLSQFNNQDIETTTKKANKMMKHKIVAESEPSSKKTFTNVKSENLSKKTKIKFEEIVQKPVLIKKNKAELTDDHSRQPTKIHFQAIHQNSFAKPNINFNELLSMNTNINEGVNLNLTNIKTKLTSLLGVPNESTKAFAPVGLNFNSLKQKLGNALEVGAKLEKQKRFKKNGRFLTFDTKTYYLRKNNKAYHCRICNITFAKLKSLNKHLSRHLGIKCLSCKLCRRRFCSIIQWKLHISKHNCRYIS